MNLIDAHYLFLHLSIASFILSASLLGMSGSGVAVYGKIDFKIDPTLCAPTPEEPNHTSRPPPHPLTYLPDHAPLENIIGRERRLS